MRVDRSVMCYHGNGKVRSGVSGGLVVERQVVLTYYRQRLTSFHGI